MTITAVGAGADPLLIPQIHRVSEVIPEIEDVVTLRVVPVDGRPPDFLPAQIGMVGAFGIGEAAISISSSRTEREHRDYTIRRAGAITSALTRLRPDDPLWVRGPFGRPWNLQLDGRDVVVAAGGLGVAPLRSAIHEIIAERQRYRDVTVVIGARTSAGLLYAREYERWRAAGLSVVTTIDHQEPGWTGRVGFVPDVVGDLDIDAGSTAALICGPDVMMRLTADRLVERGVPAASVELTLERNMQCGNGLCGHCQLGGFLVCRDGPVLPYAAVADLLSIEEL